MNTNPTVDDWAPYPVGVPAVTIPTPEGMVAVSAAEFHSAIGPLERLEGSPVGRYNEVTGYRYEHTQDRRLVGVSYGPTHLCPRTRFLAQRFVKRPSP